MAHRKREDLGQFIEFLELKYQAKLNMAKANRLRKSLKLRKHTTSSETGLVTNRKHRSAYI